MSKLIEKLDIANVFEKTPKCFHGTKTFFVNEVKVCHFDFGVLVFHIFVLPEIPSCCT